MRDHAPPGVVDLRLARTYIPGFLCLARGTALILLLSKFPRSVPAMMATATVLYVDRAVRDECIFDSGAMLATVLAAHALNVFRADPQTHQLYLASEGGASASPLGRAAQACLAVTSLLLVLGVDLPWLAARWAAASQPPPAVPIAARAATVLVNGALLVAVIQTPLESPDASLQPSQVILRCYLFLGLCLVWTYGVGVRDMVEFLTRTARAPPIIPVLAPPSPSPPSSTKGNSGGGRVLYVPSVVQSFVPCHLRFTHLLLMPSGGGHAYALLVAGVASAAACAWAVYRRMPPQGAANEPHVHHEYRSGPQAPCPQDGEAAAALYVAYAPAPSVPAQRAPAHWQAHGAGGWEPLGGGMSMAPSPIVPAAKPPQPGCDHEQWHGGCDARDAYDGEEQAEHPKPAALVVSYGDGDGEGDCQGDGQGDAETAAMFEAAMRARQSSAQQR